MQLEADAREALPYVSPHLLILTVLRFSILVR